MQIWDGWIPGAHVRMRILEPKEILDSNYPEHRIFYIGATVTPEDGPGTMHVGLVQSEDLVLELGREEALSEALRVIQQRYESGSSGA